MVCTLSSAKSNVINSVQVEFTQLYSDGSVLSVNNNPLFDIFPKNEMKKVYRFPEMNYVSLLFDSMKKLALIQKTNKTKVALKKGHEFETIESFLNKELGQLIFDGLVSKKVEDNQRGVTAKGAILFAWKLSWPIKVLFDRKDVQHALNALNE